MYLYTSVGVSNENIIIIIIIKYTVVSLENTIWLCLNFSCPASQHFSHGKSAGWRV